MPQRRQYLVCRGDRRPVSEELQAVLSSQEGCMMKHTNLQRQVCSSNQPIPIVLEL